MSGEPTLAVWSCAWLIACGATTAGTAAPQVDGYPPVAAPRTFVSPYAYEHFVRAELAEARGQHAEAAEEYRMALTSGDDDPYVLSRLATACEAARDRACADDALADALELDARSEAAWLAKGSIAELRGSPEEAIAAYERAESATATSSEATRRLAALLRSRGAPERALAVLERASKRGPRDAQRALSARLELALQRGDADAIERAAAELLAAGAADADLLRRTAAELARARSFALAARVLAPLPPSEADARLRLQVALARGDRAAAERLLLETPASFFGGPLEVARAYVDLGLFSQAQARLDERDGAADEDPNLRALVLGRCLLGLGRPAEAASSLVAVPAGSSHFAAARQALAQALVSAGQAELASELR